MAKKAEDIKPLALAGLARSGTTLFSEIIGQFLQRTQNVTYLGEVFNHWEYSYWEYEGQIAKSSYPEIVKWVKPLTSKTEKMLCSVTRYRADLLLKYKGGYFFKVIVGPNAIPFSDPFFSNFDWILVQRKDLFDQFLSYCIAKQTGVWFSAVSVEARNIKITFDPNLIKVFEHDVIRFLMFRSIIRPSKTLFYEDHADEPSPSKILHEVGLTIPSSMDNSFYLPLRQSFSSKLKFFKNPNSVKKHYDRSFLPELAKRLRGT